MSGGAFEYKQYVIQEIIDRIEREMEVIRDEPFSPNTVQEMHAGISALKIAQVFAQRIDWLVSGDDGEEQFHKRLVDELRAIYIEDGLD